METKGNTRPVVSGSKSAIRERWLSRVYRGIDCGREDAGREGGQAGSRGVLNKARFTTGQ